MFKNIYRGKTVLVTGHTGFKGSWLSFWLKELGAKVVGYSLPPSTKPSHFDLLKLDMVSILGDITDEKKLQQTFRKYKPQIVFHMAAQPLVRYSYDHPEETFNTNVMGTLHVLQACRAVGSVKAIINITSDKCYQNQEWLWGYRETDPMGGYDPYSASKGCAELLAQSYRNSFFNVKDYGKKHNTLLASVRAGNVIGGGDWSLDRLIPDIAKAASKKKFVEIRSPYATRPWQHVLEPLSGYLLLGQQLLEGKKEFAEGWNFGPENESNANVETVVRQLKAEWPQVSYKIKTLPGQPHEATLLKLDCSKARARLGWVPVWGFKKTMEHTADWYKNYYESGTIFTRKNLQQYIEDSKQKNAPWAN